jgi:hypothetical protein
MNQTILLSTKDVEKLKQKARKLKRAEGLPHHEALDRVAVDAGLPNWHHICESAKQFKPTEKAFFAGCVIAMDIKDGFDFDTEDGVFIEDHNAWALCRDDLFDDLANRIDKDDPQERPLKETLSPEKLDDWFHDDLMNYTFFRLHAETSVATIGEVLKLVRDRSFWPPQFIWLRGEFYDTYDVPAMDDQGKITGVRF